MPILGYFNVYNTLAAISTCISLGMGCEEVISRVKTLKVVPRQIGCNLKMKKHKI